LEEVKASSTIKIRLDDSESTKLITDAYCPIHREGEGKVSVRFKLRLKLLDSWEIGLSQWSSLNPVSLAWEVIPYSFVVDWLIDVGSFLRNWETALLFGVRFKDGYVSTLEAYKGKETAQNNANGMLYGVPNGYPRSWWPAGEEPKAFRRYVNFNRTVLASWPYPRQPTFHVGLGSQRLFSAASLIRQLLDRNYHSPRTRGGI
jgi:hypothetical protein